MAKGQEKGKWDLPKEFADAQMKLSAHERKPEVEIVAETKPDYSATKLKPTEVTKHPTTDSPHLPREYGEIQLKLSAHEHKPEVDIVAPPTPHRPSFAPVELRRSARNLDELEKRPEDIKKNKHLPKEYGEIQLKLSAHEHKPEVDIVAPPTPHRPSFEPVALRRSARNLDELERSEDIKKSKRHSLPAEFNAVQLRKTAIQPLDPLVEPSTGEEYTAVHLKKTTVEAAPAPKTSQEAPFAGFALKSTGNADVLKTGGDVVSDKNGDKNLHELPSEYAAVKLKKADASEKKPKVDLTPEVAPEYSAVQLKSAPKPPETPKSTTQRRASYADVPLKKSEQGNAILNAGEMTKKGTVDDPNKHSLPGEFASVQGKLKKATPVKKAADTAEVAAPAYSVVQLKKGAPPVEKPKMEQTRASFANTPLKQSGYGDAIKNGGDVTKKENPISSEPEPAYATPKLKSTGHAGAILSGGDVKVEKTEDPNKNALPGEFAAIQGKLKKATPIKKEVDTADVAAPEYSVVQLKKSQPIEPKKVEPRRASYVGVELKKSATPIEKPKAESRRASYVEVQLKATGQGDALKLGKDVDSPKIEKSFDLPDAFGAVKLKKSVDRASELE